MNPETPRAVELREQKLARLRRVWDVMIAENILPIDISLNTQQYFEYHDTKEQNPWAE